MSREPPIFHKTNMLAQQSLNNTSLETMYKMSFQNFVTFVSISQPRCLPIWQEFVFNYGEMNKSFFLETENIIKISCIGMVIG